MTGTAWLTSTSNSGDASTSEDHKNEGFLKSIWHNLTNHPGHQKPEGQADATSKATDSGEKSDSDKKSDSEKKD